MSVHKSFLQYTCQCLVKVNVKYVIKRLWHLLCNVFMFIYACYIFPLIFIQNNKRLLHDIFHIGPCISPRLPCQARQRSWSADMGREYVNVLGKFYKQFLTSLYISTLFGIFLKPDSKQKYVQVEQRQFY
jgi:hypothetical protein